MKFSLIVAVVVLALAQGSFAQEPLDLERFSQYVQEMKNKMTQELSELIRNQDLASQAQTFLEDKKTQLEPLAAQVKEQVQTTFATLEEQIRPLATSAQAQLQPLMDDLKKQIEEYFQRIPAVGN